MGFKYCVYYSKYPYKGYPDASMCFDTYNQAVRFARKKLKQGYNIIDIQCRDIKPEYRLTDEEIENFAKEYGIKAEKE